MTKAELVYPIKIIRWDDEEEMAWDDEGNSYYYNELIPSPDYLRARLLFYVER